jgi:hypothetical protein
MSRSPKYTTASLVAARERELAERRRQREQERKRREEEARAKRRAAARAGITSELAKVRAVAETCAQNAAAAGLTKRHGQLMAELDKIAARTSSATTESELKAARGQVDAASREVNDITLTAAGILATRERAHALASLRASLTTAPDRAELDQAGAAEVDKLLAGAEGKLSSAEGFPAAQAALAAAIGDHLSRVQARRAALAQMREEAGIARSAVTAVLSEARSADVELDGAADAERLLTRLAAAVDAQDVPLASSLSAELRRAGQDLERSFDSWLDQLDRAQLVFDAVTRALPRAGFTIMADTYAAEGTGARVRAQRSDGSSVLLSVVPREGDRVEIVYHADGTDFVVEQTADGEIARCDLTEEILERFHTELAAEDVEAGELRWQDKPATRPDAKEARVYWQQSSQAREIR